MVDRVIQYSPTSLFAGIAALTVFLIAGCQELPKSTWPATARGAQPALETAATPDPATVRKTVLPRIRPGIAKKYPVAATLAASDLGADGNSWLSEIDLLATGADSETSSTFRPAFAGGLASPIDASLIDPLQIDQQPAVDSIDCRAGDASPPNGAGGLFGAGSEGDDPPFGNSDGALVQEPVQQPVQQIEQPISFRDDIKDLPAMFWNDAKSIATWQNAIVLGAAVGGALVIRDDLDQKVRYETAEHPLRWGQGSVAFRQFGEYSVQVPVLAGVYAFSLWAEDDRLHEFSKAAFSAYGLTALSTVAIKGVTNTSRPTTQFQNGHYGFPSYHAASTFTIAAVIEEYYGWQAGLPAYAVAGLVGWSRIDQREHDLSDVLFGSVLGFVIGKTVAAAHLDRQADMKITPYYDAQNRATGVSLEKRY